MRQPGRSDKRAQDVPGNNGSINARDLEMDQWLLYCSSGALPVVGIPIISPDLACRAIYLLLFFLTHEVPFSLVLHRNIGFCFSFSFSVGFCFSFSLSAHFSLFLLTH